MKKALIVSASFLLPFLVSAQGGITNINTNIVRPIGNIVDVLIPIVFALAILYFFWGLASYILSADHDKEVAKKRMLWGVIAIFVMASVWGLVAFLRSNLGITNNTVPSENIFPVRPNP